MKTYHIKVKSNKNESYVSYQEISVYRYLFLFVFFLSVFAVFYFFFIAHQEISQNMFLYKVLGTSTIFGLLGAFYFHPQDWFRISSKNGTIHTVSHNTVKINEIKKIVVRPNQSKGFVAAHVHNYEIPLSGVVSVKTAKKIEKIVLSWLQESVQPPMSLSKPHPNFKPPSRF